MESCCVPRYSCDGIDSLDMSYNNYSYYLLDSVGCLIESCVSHVQDSGLDIYDSSVLDSNKHPVESHCVPRYSCDGMDSLDI